MPKNTQKIKIQDTLSISRGTTNFNGHRSFYGNVIILWHPAFIVYLTSDPLFPLKMRLEPRIFEYFTNNINGCQITKEGKKKKKVGDLSSLQQICNQFFLQVGGELETSQQSSKQNKQSYIIPIIITHFPTKQISAPTSQQSYQEHAHSKSGQAKLTMAPLLHPPLTPTPLTRFWIFQSKIPTV